MLLEHDMEVNKFAFKTDASMLISAYLKAINGVVGLTNKELEVMHLLVESVEDSREITTRDRENIRSVLGIGQFDVNNYIGKLKKKGAIIQKETGLFVNPKLIPVLSREGLSVHIDIFADGSG